MRFAGKRINSNGGCSNTFFYKDRQVRTHLDELARERKLKTSRTTIRAGIDERAYELQRDAEIERKYKIQNSYKEGELDKRIRKKMVNIWYIPILANFYKVADFNLIRDTLFADAVSSLDLIISNANL